MSLLNVRAAEICPRNSSAETNHPGRSWVKSFLSKHNSVPVNPRSVPTDRLVSPNVIKNWYSELSRAMSQFEYPVQLIYNVDETYLDLDGRRRSKVAVPEEYCGRPVVEDSPGPPCDITYIPFICADGTSLPDYCVISNCKRFFGPDSYGQHGQDGYDSSGKFPGV